MKFLILFLLLFFSENLFAQSLIADRNGDGVVTVMAFGDSLTYGVGDGTNPGEFVEIPPFTNGTGGYPRIIAELSGLIVKNAGNPGEHLTGLGVSRFPGELLRANADIVIIFEGTNDATFQTNTSVYTSALQMVTNIANSLGSRVILVSLPQPCCNRTGREALYQSFSSLIKDRASVNDTGLADVELTWQTTCANKSACELYNVPEGLHPNSRGYQAIAETILAEIYGVNIFAPGGAAELEDVLGLPAGTVIVKPAISL